MDECLLAASLCLNLPVIVVVAPPPHVENGTDARPPNRRTERRR